MNILLKLILETKRPTNKPEFCMEFTYKLLKRSGFSPELDLGYNLTVTLGNKPTTCFTAHQDTVDHELGFNILVERQGMVSVKGGGILGADAGSGIYLMIRMMLAKVPGTYVFFSQEELGRVGSQVYDMPPHITKCISFDRKGTDNLITHQMGERGCSKAFTKAFLEDFDLDFVADPTGSFTDSYSFFKGVPECVNLSVGYYNQHTRMESQDIVFLEQMVKACIKMPWEALPAEYEADYEDDFVDDELVDLVYQNPELTAAMLADYGITAKDLQKYIDQEAYQPAWKNTYC